MCSVNLKVAFRRTVEKISGINAFWHDKQDLAFVIFYDRSAAAMSIWCGMLHETVTLRNFQTTLNVPQRHLKEKTSKFILLCLFNSRQKCYELSERPNSIVIMKNSI